MKSSIREIEAKFDQMAERYTNLETGQDTALDSPLSMELISRAASIYTPNAGHILDLGCGGGNYLMKLTSLLPHVDVTLVDLSQNMLDTAAARIGTNITGKVSCIKGDYKAIELGEKQYDVIIATTTLHHLRNEAEWKLLFQKIFAALKPGGSCWISDIILHENPAINELMLNGWYNWILAKDGPEKLAWVKEQFQREDTPQTLEFQLELLKKVGFTNTLVLHKHFCFAVFGAFNK
jgi:tRNA (cmo5U34)-methyltransferase